MSRCEESRKSQYSSASQREKGQEIPSYFDIIYRFAICCKARPPKYSGKYILMQNSENFLLIPQLKPLSLSEATDCFFFHFWAFVVLTEKNKSEKQDWCISKRYHQQLPF